MKIYNFGHGAVKLAVAHLKPGLVRRLMIPPDVKVLDFVLELQVRETGEVTHIFKLFDGEKPYGHAYTTNCWADQDSDMARLFSKLDKNFTRLTEEEAMKEEFKALAPLIRKKEVV